MITAIIADDESHARERLRELLDRFAAFDILAEAKDGNEALQLIITRKPEVAFLDINMPGVSVFQSLPSLQDPPLIVFQTAYSEHAAEAFNIDAVDYLLKPVRFERLEKAVTKILAKRDASLQKQQLTSEPQPKPAEQLSVNLGGKTKVLAARDIVRISFEGGFCYLYTEKEKLLSDKYLNYYEEKLQGSRFFRVSRNDIINLNQISMINKALPGMHVIELQNGTKIELSRRKARELKKIFDF